MSKIQQELEIAANVANDDKNEDYQNYLVRLIEGISGKVVKGGIVGGISDKDWGELSEKSQKWVEDNVDALEAGKDVRDFPDKEEDKVSRSRRASIAGLAASNLEDKEKTINDVDSEIHIKVDEIQEGSYYGISFKDVNNEVNPIKSHRGKVEEVTKRSVFIVDEDEKEHSISKKNITCVLIAKELEGESSTTVEDTTSKEDSSRIQVKEAIKGSEYLIDSDGGSELILCTCIRVTNSRGVFEDEDGGRYKLGLDDNIVVLEESEKAQESEKEEGEDSSKVKEKKETSVVKTSNGKVSVHQRIKEIICNDFDIAIDAIKKVLKDEDIKCPADSTLKSTYKETQNIISILKTASKLK